MAACTYCGAETQLYANGVPICLKCSDDLENKAKKKPPASSTTIRKVLVDEIVEATTRANQACKDFLEVMGTIPSGFPHPDGSQRIHNASHNLSTARKNLMQAHTRLDDFLKTGVVPDDLKRSG